MDLSIIIVSYNTKEMTLKAIDLVKKSLNQRISYEMIVIDNASKDESADAVLESHPECILIRNHTNVGFGRANNQSLEIAQGRYLLLLNTDAFVEPDTIEKTLHFMDEHPSTGILGVKLLGRDGTLQPSCRYFPTPVNLFMDRSGFKRFFPMLQYVDDMTWDHQTTRNCDWVPGCYYLIRREVIQQVGLFDPLFFLYYEEVDHCKATKNAGWDVTYFPYTTVVHVGGESAKTSSTISNVSRQISSLQIESEILYFRKNHGFLGLLGHVVLSMICEVLLMLKRSIKTRLNLKATFDMRSVTLMMTLLFKTGFGTKPVH